MLKDAPILAIGGVDTTENDLQSLGVPPEKFCEFFLEFVDFRAAFYRNFTKFCRNNQNYQISAENCEHLLKFGQHFCEHACLFHVTPTTRRGRFL